MAARNELTPDQKMASPRRSIGCGAFILLLALGLLGGGAWLMQGWDQSGAVQRTGAVVLLVLGSALTLPSLIFLIAMILVRLFRSSLKGWFGGQG